MVLGERATLCKVRPAVCFILQLVCSPSIAHTLTDWVTEYGPVVTLRQGNHVVVVIGRVDVRFLFRSMYHVR